METEKTYLKTNAFSDAEKEVIANARRITGLDRPALFHLCITKTCGEIVDKNEQEAVRG